jgi:two-component system, autoinducer 2 sensor kinase/phosphatase LuxQ
MVELVGVAEDPQGSEESDTNSMHNIDMNVYLKCFVHELRTPLNTINMGLNILKDKCPHVECKEMFNELLQSVAFMNNTFSKFAVVQDGNIKLNTFKPFSIEHLIKKVESLIIYNFLEGHVTFECHIDDDVNKCYYGDAFNLKHVLINLLKNSIKYRNESRQNKIKIHVNCSKPATTALPSLPTPTPPSNSPRSMKASSVRINNISKKIASLIPEHSMIEISVCDSNDHLLPEIKKHLFETFNSTSGSGLGLYICKQIVELHGGKIKHDFIEPVGNKFTITLPLKVSDINDSIKSTVMNGDWNELAISSPLKAVNKKFNVLIVDDSELNSKMVYKALCAIPHFGKLYTAKDGKDALNKVLDNISEIDLILLDKHMPTMDGITLANTLRALQYNKVIIGVTGMNDSHSHSEFLESGVDFIFTKPIEITNFKRLGDFLAEHGADRVFGKELQLRNEKLKWV